VKALLLLAAAMRHGKMPAPCSLMAARDRSASSPTPPAWRRRRPVRVSKAAGRRAAGGGNRRGHRLPYSSLQRPHKVLAAVAPRWRHAKRLEGAERALGHPGAALL